ncbi:MATE family efflux transporter [Adhaeribacter sp. BT258]|uniref:Multidrug-efflux transporter n=1 Tax=Adhaeribacter terrigena TaxID=2793070 RepID=A0ABS1C657_9BACT|nr:MATE family efflux transporter [Adhaeribacter terrigena]MBK0404677.1 MATE family efflux transporter [Adhaeribacter terrigena]
MYALTYKDHFKANIFLAYPVVLSQLGHIMVNIFDSMMVGQLGTTELAASSLANSVFVIAMVFGMGISYSITPLVASAAGNNNHNRMSLLLVNGTVLCTFFGIILAAAGYFFAPMVAYLNQPVEVVEKAVPYISIMFLSLLPLMVFQSFKQFAEGMSITKPPMLISIFTNVLNVILVYALIYGKFGLPELGMNGAAIATCIARFLMAVIMAFYVMRSEDFKQYSYHFKRKYLSFIHMQRITKIAFPISVQMIFEVGAFSFSAVMIGWIGAKELAAHQIAISTASVSYMMASGLAAAGTIRVGMQAGRNDFSELRRAGNSNMILAIIFMTLCALLFVFLQNVIPHWYTNNTEVIQYAAGLLVIAGIFQISDGVQVVGLGVLRGLEDVKVPGLISLLAYWVVALPMGYLLGFKFGMGVYGVWTGLLVGLTIAAVLLYLRFRKLSHTH